MIQAENNTQGSHRAGNLFQLSPARVESSLIHEKFSRKPECNTDSFHMFL
jgi:hypothetical protein